MHVPPRRNCTFFQSILFLLCWIFMYFVQSNIQHVSLASFWCTGVLPLDPAPRRRLLSPRSKFLATPLCQALKRPAKIDGSRFNTINPFDRDPSIGPLRAVCNKMIIKDIYHHTSNGTWYYLSKTDINVTLGGDTFVMCRSVTDHFIANLLLSTPAKEF